MGLDGADLFVLAACSLHLVLSPYAKVEESFNLQGIHDLLTLGVRDITPYDHLEFPGVVPRTFLGALAVAGVASPVAWVVRAAGLQKIVLQYMVRGVLAALNFAALLMFKRSVQERFGTEAARFLMLICGCQFHLMFYFGRTLPNTFALGLVLCAYAYWLRRAIKRSIFLFTFTIIVVRGDTAVLFAPVLLWIFIQSGFNKILHIIGWGIMATTASLLLTIVVDSYFWNRWLWPEGEVLWLNAVENRSHEWGVSPPLWYFYSALPRALLATALLVPFGISSLLPVVCTASSWKHVRLVLTQAPLFDRDVWTFVWPIGLYLALFSLLPHKELRFIFNAIPMLNMAAAVGAAKLCRDGKKASFRYLFVTGCLVATMVGSVFFFLASSQNYPGGHAFSRLHDLHQSERSVARSVHIDVPAAMTGVSRFGQEFDAWSYSKDEALLTPDDLARFDFLLTAKSPSSLASDFELVEAIAAFDHVDYKRLPPQIHTKDTIYILRNRKLAG